MSKIFRGKRALFFVIIWRLPEPVSYTHLDVYKRQGKADQIVTGEHALRVLRVMEAAMESDEKGIVVHFE